MLRLIFVFFWEFLVDDLFAGNPKTSIRVECFVGTAQFATMFENSFGNCVTMEWAALRVWT
jgi:hypothetical protein